MMVTEKLRKILLLSTLACYTTLSAFVLHRSRDVPNNQQYHAASSILLGELLKLCIAVALIPKAKQTQTISEHYHNIIQRIIGGRESQHVALASGLYVLQNTLQLKGMMYLSPLTYQTLSQFKIAVVAFLSVVLLNRKLSKQHWLAILTLLLGVTVVQTSSVKYHPDRFLKDTNKTTLQFLGPICILSSCFFGSLAGIILERKIKKDTQAGSLWIFNAQLSLFSIIPAVTMLVSELIQDRSYNMMHGFTAWAYLTVLLRAAGGILVALVLKHADNILKAFATSTAIILSLVLSALITQTWPTREFLLGTMLVIFSTMGYAYSGQTQKISSLDSGKADVEKA